MLRLLPGLTFGTGELWNSFGMKHLFVVVLCCLLFTVRNVSADTYSLGTSTILEGPAGGSNSVVLAVTPETGTWTASTNAAWLHLSDGFQNGTGSTNIIFSVDANAGSTRSGTITISGQTLTVNQAGSNYVPAGTLETLVSGGLNNPLGLALDASGNVYMADNGNNAVKVWCPTNNQVSTLFSSGLNAPYSVAVDGSGNVYVADTGNEAVKEWIAANSNVITIASFPDLFLPTGVAVDSAGNIYIADEDYDPGIKVWSPADNSVTTLISSGLNRPFDVALDKAGNVYIADAGDHAVKEWSPATGNLTTLVSSPVLGAHFVTVDGSGNVYFADVVSNSVGKWSPVDNSIRTVVPSGLNTPSGVAVDGSGNVYVDDGGNNAVKELPCVFVDPITRLEGLDAGTDNLPVVLPSTANFLPPFSPTSDQSWLTILGSTNGSVSFGFTTNSGPARTAHIQLFGQTNVITQGTIGTPACLTGVQVLSNGAFQFSFTNDPSASLTVLSATDLASPLANWAVLGPATNVSSNLFQFTFEPSTNDPNRFFMIRSP